MLKRCSDKIAMRCLLALLVMLAFVMTGQRGSADAAFYCPEALRETDMEDPASQWCWERSRESEHFICFWESGFGSDPGQASDSMRVDVDDLLEKAERFWHTNVDRVGMADMSHTRLLEYKMQIYLLYTEDWVATGAGYDDMIGALWVSPMACQPVGSVIAHEVAHCFQYQVYCDQLMNGEISDFQGGFRYGHPDGNTFWEQCAQWVSVLDYPEAAYEEMGNWPQLCNLSFENEWTRYQSYWLQSYWAEIHGEDAIGKLWRKSRYPEDSLAAYTRLFCENDITRMNDELFSYAVFALSKMEPENALCYETGDGWQQIGYASCPGVAGFCAVELPVGTTGISFQGLEGGSALAAEDPGIYRAGEEPIAGGTVSAYNQATVEPGWRFGMVAMMEDGQIILGNMGNQKEEDVFIDLTSLPQREYLIVVGTPEQMIVHSWDEDERTDAQFPFRYQILEFIFERKSGLH